MVVPSEVGANVKTTGMEPLQLHDLTRSAAGDSGDTMDEQLRQNSTQDRRRLSVVGWRIFHGSVVC